MPTAPTRTFYVSPAGICVTRLSEARVSTRPRAAARVAPSRVLPCAVAVNPHVAGLTLEGLEGAGRIAKTASRYAKSTSASRAGFVAEEYLAAKTNLGLRSRGRCGRVRTTASMGQPHSPVDLVGRARGRVRRFQVKAGHTAYAKGKNNPKYRGIEVVGPNGYVEVDGVKVRLKLGSVRNTPRAVLSPLLRGVAAHVACVAPGAFGQASARACLDHATKYMAGAENAYEATAGTLKDACWKGATGTAQGVALGVGLSVAGRVASRMVPRLAGRAASVMPGLPLLGALVGVGTGLVKDIRSAREFNYPLAAIWVRHQMRGTVLVGGAALSTAALGLGPLAHVPVSFALSAGTTLATDTAMRLTNNAFRKSPRR